MLGAKNENRHLKRRSRSKSFASRHTILFEPVATTPSPNTAIFKMAKDSSIAVLSSPFIVFQIC